MDNYTKQPQSPGHAPTLSKKEKLQKACRGFVCWLNNNRSTVLGWLMIVLGAGCLLFFRGVLRNLIEILPHLFMFIVGLLLIYFGLKVLRFTKITDAIARKAKEYKDKYLSS